MPSPHAVLDANVLAQAYVRDLLLDADALGLCRLRWTDAILDETRRVYIHELGRNPAAIDALLTAMRREFPRAAIIGYGELIAAMTVDSKDRHVAAAATWARADVVTFNLRHFLPRDLAPFGVQAFHPDLFLTTLAEDHQEGVVWRKGKYCTLRPCDGPQGAEAALLDALIRSPGVIAGQVNMVPVDWCDVSE